MSIASIGRSEPHTLAMFMTLCLGRQKVLDQTRENRPRSRQPRETCVTNWATNSQFNIAGIDRDLQLAKYQISAVEEPFHMRAMHKLG